MGLFNFFKSDKVPPPLFHHGEPGGNGWMSPIPGPRDPRGMDRKNVDARIAEEARAKDWYERNPKGLGQFRMHSDTRDVPSGVRPSRRQQKRLDKMMGRGCGGPFRRGDHGLVEMPDHIAALGFPVRRRERRRARFEDMMGMGRGDSAVPDHSFGRWDNDRGGGGRGQGGGRGPRGPASGDKASAWNKHD